MKQKWQKNEKKDATSFEAKQTPRSGGLWFFKGDSKNSQFLIDSKLTEKGTYSITEKTWVKLVREALLSKRLPILSVTFGKEKKHEVVVLDKNDFLTLIEESGNNVELPKDCEWCDDCEGKGYHKIWTK